MEGSGSGRALLLVQHQASRCVQPDIRLALEAIVPRLTELPEAHDPVLDEQLEDEWMNRRMTHVPFSKGVC